jgi:hypothetical protein
MIGKDQEKGGMKFKKVGIQNEEPKFFYKR